MIELTHSPKNALLVQSPVLLGAGSVGFDASPYRKLMSLEKFGAMVTAPITLNPRQPANGSRVVTLPAGFLLHTGLPNPGVWRIIRGYDKRWRRLPIPVIVHLIAESARNVEEAVQALAKAEYVAGIELGLHEEVSLRDMHSLFSAARGNTDLPVMAQIPLYRALEVGEAAQHSGAEALILAAPPRGTVRDAQAGRLVGGRLYGAWLKAQVVRVVGQMAQLADIPVIASGGLQSAEDVQDCLTAGAIAAMLDTIVWRSPQAAEAIADAFSGQTSRTQAVNPVTERPAFAPPPPDLPELSFDDDATRDSRTDETDFTPW